MPLPKCGSLVVLYHVHAKNIADHVYACCNTAAAAAAMLLSGVGSVRLCKITRLARVASAGVAVAAPAPPHAMGDA